IVISDDDRELWASGFVVIKKLQIEPESFDLCAQSARERIGAKARNQRRGTTISCDMGCGDQCTTTRGERKIIGEDLAPQLRHTVETTENHIAVDAAEAENTPGFRRSRGH